MLKTSALRPGDGLAALPVEPGLELSQLSPDDPAWLELVHASPGATVFHLGAWTRVLRDAYGYPAAVLAQLGPGGRVMAGVPVVRVRRLRGSAWVSLPFTDHCSPLARDGASLPRLAAGLARWSERVRSPVELHAGLPALADWTQSSVGVRHVLCLDDDLDVLRGRLSRGHRDRLRKAERSPLRVRVSRSADDLQAFYRLQVKTRRRHGVPVQPRRFFDAVWRHVIRPGLGAIALVDLPEAGPIAGAVMFAWNGIAIGKFQASDTAHWRQRPNHLLYWAAIRWASEGGCRVFDFGRSEPDHVGLQKFKTGWGAESVPLAYSAAGGGKPSLAGRSRLDALVGPLIRRSPAFVCRALGGLLYRFAG